VCKRDLFFLMLRSMRSMRLEAWVAVLRDGRRIPGLPGMRTYSDQVGQARLGALPPQDEEW
jgi:hypothetical protein